ncbi:aryl-sulfate sulfotransferase [Winogradskyella tangerina]|uniref:aryl-sulfate sulfotransferase n=1 Tax=Winogradskyella tangerina TaxID=2023240 RepID=UPI000DBE489C|nr:aryl-sulfate sulfotransferase [Winogradskyella tangerina]
MIKRLLFVFLLTILTDAIQSQNTIGTLSITSDAYEGLTLFSTHTKAYLINNCGQVVNEWNSTYLPGNAVYLLPNGNLLRTGRLAQGSNPVALPGNGGIVELFDWDGNIIWSWIDSSDTSRQHHDVFPMPNGNVLILAATLMTDTEAIQAGRDPNKLINSELYNERIYEVEPVGATGGNIVWEWNVKDHLIQDFDATKDNFGVVGDNPGKLDINFLNGFNAENNWLHINAIQYDEEFDQILISSRRMSEIYAIDRNTTTAEAAGSAGDFLYRWGNPQAYRQGTEANRELYGQHTPYYIPSGFPNERKLMVFNNGINRSPAYSEVLIIEPPVDVNGDYTYFPGTAYEPFSSFFRYPETAPVADSDFFSAIVSSGRQLQNGNILICEGREAYFFEIDTNNNIVWEYISPVSNADGSTYEQGEMPPPNNFAFRATKYSMNYSAFDGRDLTPGNTIETNPDITDCLDVLNVNEFEVADFEIFPNPTQSVVNINSKLPFNKLEVYSSLGQKVMESANTSIDISNQPNGLYFFRIYTDAGVETRKIIKR